MQPADNPRTRRIPRWIAGPQGERNEGRSKMRVFLIFGTALTALAQPPGPPPAPGPQAPGREGVSPNNRCPSVAIAGFHAAVGNTAWAYEFSHPLQEAMRWAVHSGELRYIFGVFPADSVADSERKILNGMQATGPTTRRPAIPTARVLPPGGNTIPRRAATWNSPARDPWKK
jgi:hypothetical protein